MQYNPSMTNPGKIRFAQILVPFLVLLGGNGPVPEGQAQQVTGQDVERILERADKLLDEAKAGYDSARDSGSVEAFVDAGFRLEEARIKFIVIQEIGSADKQKIAADRMRVVNQLNKLIHDGRVAVSGTAAKSSTPKIPEPSKADAPPAAAPVVAPQVDIRTRVPVPDPAREHEAEKTVRDLLKDQYAKKSTVDRLTLARTLLDHAARSTDDPLARWVFFREARDVAVAAGDLPTAIEAVDGMSANFDVDALALKQAAATVVAKSAKSAAEFAVVTEVLLQLMEQFVALDQYDPAEKAGVLAVQCARKSSDPGLSARASSRSKDCADAKAAFASMKGILEALAKNPDAAPANLEMGQFLCLIKGSWDLGIRFLVRGSDPTLKALSEKELAIPTQPADQATIADGWWDLAEKEKVSGRKEKLQTRACFWYNAALPGAPTLLHMRIEKRLEELLKIEEPPAAGLVGRWLFNEGAGMKASDTSGKNNHATLNGTKWTLGYTGNALSFEGEGYVSCGITGLPAPNSPQTIAWAQFVKSNPSGNQILINIDDAGTKTAMSPGFHDGKLGVWKWAEVWLVSTTPPSPGEWHCLAYTYDGKTHKLYVDGALKDSSTAAPQTAPPKRLEFGRWSGGGGVPPASYFTGILDDVRIYSRALPESEIRMLVKSRR
jgi:hypothetical protein